VTDAERDSFPGGGWTVIVALALGSLVSVGVAIWYCTRQRETTESEVSRQLAAILEAKSTQIPNWRRERLGDGRLQAASNTMPVARRILSGSSQATDRSSLIAVVQELEKEFAYTGAFLADRRRRFYTRTASRRWSR
jgi:type II secretory pathway component PulJ